MLHAREIRVNYTLHTVAECSESAPQVHVSAPRGGGGGMRSGSRDVQPELPIVGRGLLWAATNNDWASTNGASTYTYIANLDTRIVGAVINVVEQIPKKVEIN